MKVYTLIKPFDAPNFVRTVDDLGGQFPENTLKRWFNTSDVESLPRFAEFFVESKTHKIEHCRLIPIEKSKINE